MERAPADPARALAGDPAPGQAAELDELRRALDQTRAELAAARVQLGDRHRVELASRHTQRLESLGQLAAGVAHEINTPMQFISDNVHFLREGFHGVLVVLDRLRIVRELARAGAVPAEVLIEVDQAEVDADLDYLTPRLESAFARTVEGIDRVSTIVAAMKVFAHPRNDLADVDLNEVLTTTLTVARNEYKYAADVVTELGILPLVLGHAGDLNQAFLNLIVNAAHAVVDAEAELANGRGTITVRTRHGAGQVVVEISDTGRGIPAAHRDRVFDPTRTPDGPGRGGGPALATALAVVERHCGLLTFESELGAGTTFRVTLPVNGPETSTRMRRITLVP